VILVSAVLVLVALVLLLYGVIASDGVLEIWLSIAASLAAALLLFIGVLRQRRQLAASAPATTDVPTDAPAPADTASPAEGPSSAAAAPAPDDTAAPPADEPETALDRVAAHDSAPVVTVEAPPDAAPTPAVEPAPQLSTDVPEEPDAPDAAGAASPGESGSTNETSPVDVGASAPSLDDASLVLVLTGRPRYHVPGCRFLDGRDDIEVMQLDDAQAQGYTPCSVCRA